MHFTIQREALLKPLQLVAGVVERRQTLPVLSNVLLVVQGQQLSLTGTDLEVELVAAFSWKSLPSRARSLSRRAS
jgi:DNA polymerase-3 subunit beta